MNYTSDPRTLIPWCVMVAVEAVLSLILLRPSSKRPYPYNAFRTFIFFSLIRSVTLLLLAQLAPYKIYWWSYWSSQAVWVSIHACVVFELFAQLFRPLTGVPASTLKMFVLILSGLVISAVAVGILVPAGHPDSAMNIVRTANRTFAYCEAAAVILVLLFARYYMCHWRDRTYGIAIGLTFDLVVRCNVLTVLAPMKAPASIPLLALSPVTFTVSLLIWCFYFAQPERRTLVLREGDALVLLNLFKSPLARQEQERHGVRTHQI